MIKEIRNVEFCCPECRIIKNINVEMDEFIEQEIAQFDFECQCGCKFKYQYDNVSYRNEMSAYKNKHTMFIRDEVGRIQSSIINRQSKTQASH